MRFPRRLTAAAIAVIAALSGTAARAWWADTATATATAAAHAVVSQAQPVCENTPALLGLLGSARFTWTHVDDRYVYDWQLVRTDGTQVDSGTITPSVPAGGSISYTWVNNILNLGLGVTNFNFVLRARLRDAPTWTAPSETSSPMRADQLVVSLTLRCGHL